MNKPTRIRITRSAYPSCLKVGECYPVVGWSDQGHPRVTADRTRDGNPITVVASSWEEAPIATVVDLPKPRYIRITDTPVGERLTVGKVYEVQKWNKRADGGPDFPSVEDDRGDPDWALTETSWVPYGNTPPVSKAQRSLGTTPEDLVRTMTALSCSLRDRTRNLIKAQETQGGAWKKAMLDLADEVFDDDKTRVADPVAVAGELAAEFGAKQRTIDAKVAMEAQVKAVLLPVAEEMYKFLETSRPRGSMGVADILQAGLQKIKDLRERLYAAMRHGDEMKGQRDRLDRELGISLARGLEQQAQIDNLASLMGAKTVTPMGGLEGAGGRLVSLPLDVARQIASALVFYAAFNDDGTNARNARRRLADFMPEARHKMPPATVKPSFGTGRLPEGYAPVFGPPRS